jgi:hypothetical protein
MTSRPDLPKTPRPKHSNDNKKVVGTATGVIFAESLTARRYRPRCRESFLRQLARRSAAFRQGKSSGCLPGSRRRTDLATGGTTPMVAECLPFSVVLQNPNKKTRFLNDIRFYLAENGGNAIATGNYEIVTALAVGFVFFNYNRIGGPRSRPCGFVGRHSGESLPHFQSLVPFHQSGEFHRRKRQRRNGHPRHRTTRGP